MNNEKYIDEHGGKHNPFQVPNGYMESLTEQIMCRVRQQEEARAGKAVQMPLVRKSRWSPRYWVAIAACACIAIFSVTFFLNEKMSSTDNLLVEESITYDDEYINAITEYAMLDNGDLYTCMEEY